MLDLLTHFTIGIKKEQLHSVEMIGDATRIPIVQQKCKDVFGVEQVSRTLNSLEAVARGCSLQAAMLSPLFKVADYEVQEYNSLPVSITYSFPPAEGEQVKAVTKELFPVGSSFPSTKTITFDNKKGGMSLLVHYSEGASVLTGLPREVANYTVKEGKQKHNEKVAFILRVSNNIHQIPCLESADLQEEWTEEEKIPVKRDVPAPPKPAEAPKAEGATESQPDAEMKPTEEQKQPEAPKQEFEIRKKQKKTATALGVDSQSHALPQQVRADFTKKEADWFAFDHDILDRKATMNELESYAYDLKNNLDSYGPYEAYMESGARTETIKQLQETVDWIYGAGQQAKPQEFRDRLAAFKKIGAPVKQRYLLRTEFPVFQDQFKTYSQDINDKLAAATTLAEVTRSEIIAKYSELESYFNVVAQMFGAKAPYEDLGFTIDEVQSKYEAIKLQIAALFSAPPPKAPAPEKPAEAQPEKAPDAEMKDDSSAPK